MSRTRDFVIDVDPAPKRKKMETNNSSIEAALVFKITFAVSFSNNSNSNRQFTDVHQVYRLFEQRTEHLFGKDSDALYIVQNRSNFQFNRLDRGVLEGFDRSVFHVTFKSGGDSRKDFLNCIKQIRSAVVLTPVLAGTKCRFETEMMAD
jgi:hypothetical protein